MTSKMFHHSGTCLLFYCYLVVLLAGLHTASAGYWTAWLDEDSSGPDGVWGDYELLARLTTPPCGQTAPSKIRVAMDDALQVVLETDSLIHVGPRYGLVCKTTEHPSLATEGTSLTTDAPTTTGTPLTKEPMINRVSLEIYKWLTQIHKRSVKDGIMHDKALAFLRDVKGEKGPDVNHCHNYLVCYAHRMSWRLMPQVSQWFDMDRPGGGGDFETAHKHGYYWQTYGDLIAFITDNPESSTGSGHGIKHLLHVGPHYGLVCNATEQFTGSCSNYLVQYYCE